MTSFPSFTVILGIFVAVAVAVDIVDPVVVVVSSVTAKKFLKDFYIQQGARKKFFEERNSNLYNVFTLKFKYTKDRSLNLFCSKIGRIVQTRTARTSFGQCIDTFMYLCIYLYNFLRIHVGTYYVDIHVTILIAAISKLVQLLTRSMETTFAKLQ